MRISPFLLPAYKPFLAAAVVCLACALFGILSTSAGSFWDLGVLWHTTSHRRVTPADTHLLLGSLFVMEALAALILGGSSSIGATNLPADTARARFLLTRPKSRLSVFLAPWLLATAGLFCIPALVVFVIIGWLALVRAPVLNHLVAIAQIIPSSVSPLGAHPGLIPLLASLHIGARYLAGFSLGICMVSLFHAKRWLIFSQNPTIRSCAYFSTSFVYFMPAMIVFSKPIASELLLLPGSFTLPSMLNIGLHLVFALALCVFTLRFIHKIEI
jgi:hypothetical protein